MSRLSARILGLALLAVALVALLYAGTMVPPGPRDLLAWILLAALASGAAWVVSAAAVARRVRALAQVTRRIAGGDLGARATPGAAGDELARSFNEMAEGLERREQTLLDAQRTLEVQRERLFQSEKIAAMGELLAGVAHELNNPLAVVVGRAALLAERTAGTPLAAQATSLMQAADRCARIVESFLAVARNQPMERRPVDLNETVREACELVGYHLRVDSVTLRFELGEKLPRLSADPHQLHQVILNLLTNAHHALRGVDGPRAVRIVTAQEPDGARLRLEVTDTGPGIPPHLLPRVFEAFFTTKPVGQGTGLGLPLCREIVEAHGGTITVESPPGEGATFRVRLPVAAAPAVPTAVAPPPPGRPLRVLVVDDEEAVSATLSDILSADGHTVDSVADGAAALDRLGARIYDVVLSDLRMPGLDGPGLYRELGRRAPEYRSRLVFLTGDALAPDVLAFLGEVRGPTLPKPFVPRDVSEMVRRVAGARVG